MNEMDGYLILVFALIGGLASAGGWAGYRLLPDSRWRQGLGLAIAAILFAVLYRVAEPTIVADHRETVALAGLETLAAQNPAFEALRLYAPDEFYEVNESLRVAARQGEDAATVETRLRAVIASAVRSRLGRASDDAVLESARLAVDQLGWLQRRGGDACFRFLFAGDGAGIRAESAFPKALKQRDFELTREILATYDAGRAMPAEDDALAVLTPVYSALFDRHGSKAVGQMADVAAPGVDRHAVCRVSKDLYATILELPDSEAVIALRWLFQ